MTLYLDRIVGIDTFVAGLILGVELHSCALAASGSRHHGPGTTGFRDLVLSAAGGERCASGGVTAAL